MTDTTMTPHDEAEHTRDKAHGRHLRRYILGAKHRFAVIAPPEISPLCYDELQALGYEELEITEAGVEFSGDLRDCYRCNLWLRSASRVLCRLPSFRAGAMEELFAKVLSLRWEHWLNPGIPLRIRSHVERSRIQHEGLVGDTTLSAMQKRFRSLDLAPPVVWKSSWREQSLHGGIQNPHPLEQRVFIHLKENHCTISLDSTGAHLHRRGYRLHHTGAPLRETLASAILMKSGWRGDSSLVDGMTGAGTLAIEAALLARHLPPGGNRSFLFEEWPSFQNRQWEYLRRKATDGAREKAQTRIVAVDLLPHALETARMNAGSAGVQEDVEWQCMDFFQFNPWKLDLTPGLLVLNPPYGKRLSGGGRGFYERLGSHLRRYFRGWRAAVLGPERSMLTALNLPSMRFWTVVHGGIPISVAFIKP